MHQVKLITYVDNTDEGAEENTFHEKSIGRGVYRMLNLPMVDDTVTITAAGERVFWTVAAIEWRESADTLVPCVVVTQ